jgi:small subunit ribosomal protein S20
VANHPQAKKRNRQRIKRTVRNRQFKTAVRTHVKRVRSLVEEGEPQKAGEELRVAVAHLDRAVTKGLLQRSTASRTISRLTLAVKRIEKSE